MFSAIPISLAPCWGETDVTRTQKTGQGHRQVGQAASSNADSKIASGDFQVAQKP